MMSFRLFLRRLAVVFDGKLSVFAIIAGVLQGSILGPTIFLLFINNLPDIVHLKIFIYGDDTTLYSDCEKASNIWKQVEMPLDLESGFRGTVEWGSRWLDSFNAGKTQLVSFDLSANSGVINIKMNKAALKEKSYNNTTIHSFISNKEIKATYSKIITVLIVIIIVKIDPNCYKTKRIQKRL